MPQPDPNHPDNLIAELPQWNNGDGVDARSWIGMTGSYDQAVGYSLIFWPTFSRVGGCVLTGEWSDEDFGKLGRPSESGRRAFEALHNHIHMADIHCNDQTLTEAQARYLGRTLKAIYEIKLKADFPDLAFDVVFNDEPGLDLIDYQLTFWQTS